MVGLRTRHWVCVYDCHEHDVYRHGMAHEWTGISGTAKWTALLGRISGNTSLNCFNVPQRRRYAKLKPNDNPWGIGWPSSADLPKS